MRSRFNESITGWQLILLMNGCQVSTGIFQIGRMAGECHTSWISVILASLVPIFALWLIRMALQDHPQEDLPTLARNIFGMKGGNGLLLLYILSQLLITAAVLRMQLELVCMNLLPRTPVPVVAFLTAAAAYIILNRGIMALTRLNELLFYFSLLLFVFFLSPLFHEAQLTNLLPLHEMECGERLWQALQLSLLYGGTGVLFVWYPFLKEKEKMFRRAALGVLMTMIAYVFLVVTCVLVYGADIMEYMLWPVLSLLKIVPNDLVQRSDFFVLGLWIGIGMRPILNFLYAAADCASRMRQAGKRSRRFRWFSAAGCLLVCGGSLLPQNILQGFRYIHVLSLYGAAIGIVFPLIVWIGGTLHARKQRLAAK